MLKKQRDFLRIRHAKEYIDGARKNPFSFRTPPKRWIMIGGGVLVVSTIVAGAIGITYLPIFRLSGVAVSGTTIIAPEEIQKNIEEFVASHGYPLIAKNNAYLINTSAIEQRLMQSFALESANVQRNGTTLEALVKEKITTIALRTKEKTIFLGLDGAYVRDATTEESRAIDVRVGVAEATEGEVLAPLQAEMPIIIIRQNDPATSLEGESVSHVLDIAKLLKLHGMSVATFTFDGAKALFTRVDTDQPYDLFFDLNHSIADQVAALNAIVSKPGFSAPSEYIDLRFGAYVYMK